MPWKGILFAKLKVHVCLEAQHYLMILDSYFWLFELTIFFVNFSTPTHTTGFLCIFLLLLSSQICNGS